MMISVKTKLTISQILVGCEPQKPPCSYATDEIHSKTLTNRIFCFCLFLNLHLMFDGYVLVITRLLRDPCNTMEKTG